MYRELGNRVGKLRLKVCIHQPRGPVLFSPVTGCIDRAA
jgi:hypothetical protein